MKKNSWLVTKGCLLFAILLSLFQVSCDNDTPYVWVDETLPDAVLEYEASIYEVNFSNSSDHATFYSWDFGDGRSYEDVNGTLSDTTLTYTEAGVYTVILYAYDNNLTVSADTAYVSLPYLSFNNSVNWDEVSFTNNETGATSWFWDFGDGSTSSEENPVHTYSLEGDYTVSCIASTANTSNTYEETISTDSATIASPLFEDENDWKGSDGSGDAYSSSGSPTPISGTGAKVESKHDGLCQTVKVFPNQEYRITFYAAIDDKGSEGKTVNFNIYAGAIADNSLVSDTDEVLYYQNLAEEVSENTYTAFDCIFTTDDSGYITISATYVDVTTRYCTFDISPK